jgi:hypothetical protein
VIRKRVPMGAELVAPDPSAGWNSRRQGNAATGLHGPDDTIRGLPYADHDIRMLAGRVSRHGDPEADRLGQPSRTKP